MDRISFSAVVPDVFRLCTGIHSEVWDSDICFEKGLLYLVEAESGKGKSTFCSYLLGYRHDYAGIVRFDAENVAGYGVRRWTDIRQNHISMLFQELRLFPELTAWENVQIKNGITHMHDDVTLKDWFERLGIADKKNVRIGNMSFGQQQRVAMLRALSQPFDFIVADEPISHLDDANAAVMGELMVSEARRQGAGVIVTSIGKHMKLDYDKIVKL